MNVFLYSCLSHPAFKADRLFAALYYHMWSVCLAVPYFFTFCHKKHDIRVKKY